MLRVFGWEPQQTYTVHVTTNDAIQLPIKMLGKVLSPISGIETFEQLSYDAQDFGYKALSTVLSINFKYSTQFGISLILLKIFCKIV